MPGVVMLGGRAGGGRPALLSLLIGGLLSLATVVAATPVFTPAAAAEDATGVVPSASPSPSTAPSPSLAPEASASPEVTAGSGEEPTASTAAPSPSVTREETPLPATTTTTTTAPAQPAPPVVQTLQQRYLLQHRVKLYVPPKAITGLVVVLHQYASTPEAVEAQTRLVPLASRYGWLLAVPVGRGASWNAGLCCGRARAANVPDTAFLAQLVRGLRAEFSLGARVPSIMGGISNGAMEAAQVACKYPGLLDGVFLDAGNVQDPSCTRLPVKNLLMTRGVRDGTVPIGGMAYSAFLRTRLLPDQVLLNAARRGSACSITAQFLRSGIRSWTERCGGDRTLRVVRDQATHGRDNNYRPGIMNRVALSVEFINGVIRQTRTVQ